MCENWIFRGYRIKEGSSIDDLLTDYFYFLFECFEESDEVDTFHFAKNGPVINLRVKPKTSEVEQLIMDMEEEQNVDEIADIGEGDWPNRDNDFRQVGEDGVPLLDQYREYISKIAVSARDEGLSKEQLNGFTQRGSHLLGNCLGFYVNLRPDLPHPNESFNGVLQYVPHNQND